MRCFAAAHDTHEGGPVPPQGPSLRQKNRSPQLFCKRLELYELEATSLTSASPSSDDIPNVLSVGGITDQWDKLSAVGLVADVECLKRGRLLELNVELETDPNFKMISIITTLRELLEGNNHFTQGELALQLVQMQSISEVLEGLLTGLVPIRGRILNYEAVQCGERELLVHRKVLEKIPDHAKRETMPVYVVGVAERSLFWKDIRRILFSNSRYAIYCRLATNGLLEKWHPIKVVDVLEGVVPNLDELVDNFSRLTNQAMTGASVKNPMLHGGQCRTTGEIIRQYVESLNKYHVGVMEDTDINEILCSIDCDVDWLESVDKRRPIFAEVTRQVDKLLKKKTPPEMAYKFRQIAVHKPNTKIQFANCMH